MADLPITGLPAATPPLSFTDLLAMVDMAAGPDTEKVTFQEVWDLFRQGAELLDAGAVKAFDATARELYDAGGINSTLDWNNGLLLDSVGIESLLWLARQMKDSVELLAIDYDTRKLIGSDGADVIVEFSTGLGFFGTAPAAQFASSGPQTAGGVYTGTEQSMLQESYDALRVYGLLS